MHGIVVVDDGNFGDALLRHFFTGLLLHRMTPCILCVGRYVMVCGHAHGLDLSSFSLWSTLEHYCWWPLSTGAMR